MSDPGRLDGNVSVITGAASGMGLASVRRFLELGALVTAVDRDGGGRETLELAADRGGDAEPPTAPPAGGLGIRPEWPAGPPCTTSSRGRSTASAASIPTSTT